MDEISLITKENIEILRKKEVISEKVEVVLVIASTLIGTCAASIPFCMKFFMEIFNKNTINLIDLLATLSISAVIAIMLIVFFCLNSNLSYKIRNRVTPKSKALFREVEKYVEDTLIIEEASFEEIKALLNRQTLLLQSTNFIKGEDKQKALDDLSIVGLHISDLLVENNVFKNYALLALSHPFGKRYETVLKNMFDFLYTENINFKNDTGSCLYRTDSSFLDGDEFYEDPIDIFEGQKIKIEAENNTCRCLYIENILKVAYYKYYILYKNEITQTKYNISKLVPILEERQELAGDSKEDLINKLFFT